MSNLLENILNKNQKINFDFSKSYNRQNKIVSYDRDDNLPVQPKESSWENVINHNGVEVLEKTYKFNSLNHLMYFVNELLKKSDSVDHHPDVYISKGDEIKVVLYTHDLEQITDMDVEMSKYLDEIYDDIFYIKGF